MICVAVDRGPWDSHWYQYFVETFCFLVEIYVVAVKLRGLAKFVGRREENKRLVLNTSLSVQYLLQDYFTRFDNNSVDDSALNKMEEQWRLGVRSTWG